MEKISPVFKMKQSPPDALKNYIRAIDHPFQPSSVFSMNTLRKTGEIPSGAVIRLFQLAAEKEAKREETREYFKAFVVIKCLNRILAWAK